jgi:glutathione S-transferase
MTLYVKAGPDGTSVGDCPFAHYVRMVLHEKGLEYELRPCTPEKKPSWLIETYSGSMPALRHRRECYVESDIIAQYLDFFFQEPPLSLPNTKKSSTVQAKQCIDGLFPAVAAYLKQTKEEDGEEEKQVRLVLDTIETHLSAGKRIGPYLVDDGKALTLLDCSLAPKLYHLMVGVEHFKKNAIDLHAQYPNIDKYFDAVSQRDSFQQSLYPKETIIWGWSQARNKLS